jgi:hypothetical protein
MHLYKYIKKRYSFCYISQTVDKVAKSNWFFATFLFLELMFTSIDFMCLTLKFEHNRIDLW